MKEIITAALIVCMIASCGNAGTKNVNKIDSAASATGTGGSADSKGRNDTIANPGTCPGDTTKKGAAGTTGSSDSSKVSNKKTSDSSAKGKQNSMSK